MGEDCNAIRCQKGSLKFPSISPPSTSASLPIGAPTTATPFVTTIQSQGTAIHGKCLVQGCGQSRIAPDCRRRLCRRHCREAGWRSSKNHPPKTPSATAPVVPPMVIPPPLFPSAAPVPLGPIAHPLPSGHGLAIPSSQQLPLHHALPVSPADSSLDARLNPRYSSHMPPTFTEQWGREQELAEENGKRDAQHLANATKAQHGFVVYAWSEDGRRRDTHSEDAGKRWPADYLVQDIVRFFSDRSEHPQEQLRTVFHRHFPAASFHRTTYYDNVKRWKNAKQAVRDGVMGDKWSVFMKRSRKK